MNRKTNPFFNSSRTFFLKIMLAQLALCAIYLGSADAVDPTIRHVPGQYPTPAAAISAAQDGDIIEIESGTYTGSGIVATLSADNLTLRGVNGRAHLNAEGTMISNRKAIWVTRGDNITIENIEFSHAAVPDRNGAGIRHEGGRLTLRSCYFHDNENGILTSSSSTAEVLIEFSEFFHNGLGRPGYTHNMYIGHIAKFTLRYSYAHEATHGHNVKTRAAENHILYNRIMDETDGNASYLIDVPNGGLTYFIGNTLHQGENAENLHMISYAMEGPTNPIQELYASGNTLANDRSRSKGFIISGTPTAVIVNNIFDNIDTAIEGHITIFENNLKATECFFVDRSKFDFHLTEVSPACDAGDLPISWNGVDLTPVYEYVHPAGRKKRFKDGHLDVGAFEFEDSDHLSSPPASPKNLRIISQ